MKPSLVPAARRSWPPPGEFLEPELAKAYYADPWNEKYGLGLYFSALYELGDDMLMNAEVDGRRYCLPHAVCDGIGFIKLLNDRFDLGVDLSAKPYPAPTSVRAWGRSVAAAYVSSRRSPDLDLIRRQPVAGEAQGGFVHLRFEHVPDQRRVLALFLSAVHRVCAPRFCNGDTCRWMIPVSVRTQTEPSAESSLEASYLFVSAKLGASLDETHEQLLSRLKAGEHWGYYLLAKLGLHLGRWVLVRGTRQNLGRSRVRCLGSFSFFGRFGGNGRRDLALIHSVRPERPIGCALYEYGGSFHLTVSFHPALGLGPDDMREIELALHEELRAAGCLREGDAVCAPKANGAP